MIDLVRLLESYGLSPSLLAIPVSILLALLADFIGKVLLTQVADRTASDLDNHLIELLRPPIAASILLGGIGYTIAHIGLSAPSHFLLRALLLSAAILYWTYVAMQVSSLLLAWLTEHQERWSVVQPRTLPIFDFATRVVLVGGCLYFLLLAWKIDVTAWLASAGIIGVALGFAAQDTLSSLLAGVAILSDSPYKLDDYLILDDGLGGTVTRIGFRSTRLLTLDDVEVIVPNAVMASSMITNMSGGPYEHARLSVPVGVAYGADIDAVRAILLEVADALPVVQDRAALQPQVRFVSMGASSLDFVLQVWLERPTDRHDVIDAANTAIYKALTAAGIEIPYVKRDVYLYPMPPPT